MMMELSHSLTLNEDALTQIAEAKRPVFIFEWLRFLDKVLIAAQKSDIKGCQKKLVEQLTKQIHSCPGPPTRQLIARCLSTLFSVGDTFLLFETINKYNDILKNKDDSPSQLATKLAAITCIGAMYQKLGRMMGRSYEETIQILLKCLRNAESQARCEIMLSLEKICMGMENAISSVAKEIYKAARHCLTDRVMTVRCAAAKCLLEMLKHTTFLYTTELESLTSLCFRAFEGSNYDVRCTVGKLLGVLMATTQDMPKTAAAKTRATSLDEALCMMMTGFLRGGMGFLKAGAGEMIKGTSGVSRDIRVGVTHAYVTFVETLGGVWLEKNKNQFLLHVMDLVSNPKAASSHVDAVYSRKCVSFMLRTVFDRMLNEKAQLEACKELGQIISTQINNQELNVESGSSLEQMHSQHALVCALQELGSLVISLGTTAASLTTESKHLVLDSVLAVLLHPAPAARLAAAWCLRCIAVAVPSQLTPLIDKCLEKLEALKGSPEAISGYSSALAALLGAAKLCPLGMPHARGKIVFNAAEDLLRSASQNSRLSLPRTHAGWLLIGSVMTLGFSVVRSLLPRMLLIWRISFPRSAKELESEIARGDAFTWHVTLEGRAGVLSSIHSFFSYCPELINPDVIRRILTPLESALAMMCSISNVIKAYSHNLKASSALLRLRLYEALSVLPPQAFESSYNTLLRFLVAEFTLTENPANTTTSLLKHVCHADDSSILGLWLQESDHKNLEDQLEQNRSLEKDSLQSNSSSGSSALEHDPTALYRSTLQDDIPGFLPLGISVINASVTLFGSIFPRVPYKHRLKMLEHFSECVRQNKSVRQEAVQINIFTAVLSGMKGLAETKTNFGQDDVRKSAVALVLGAMTHTNPLLRWAAGEALGRMAQVVGDSRFVAEVAQNSFDKLKSARDVASRTGHSLALGCVHRYVGSMGSSQHLNTSVSILLALAQDATSPVVQAWSLHALALIGDSGGPMFRAYVEPTLSLSLKLLLSVPVAHVDVLQCLGKCLSALITTIGPELHGNTSSVCTARSSFLCVCAVLQEHPDPLVQSEAIACLQQLHMFAPRHVNLSSLVPSLCRNLVSPHLFLRRAAVSCLRQLAQREAKEVCEHASSILNESSNGFLTSGCKKQGLPWLLFAMLDIETDRKLVSDIHDTLTSMIQALAEDSLTQWLNLCKEVLTSTAENGNSKEGGRDGEGQDNEQDISDESRFHAREEHPTHPCITPKWRTRVFAAESVCRIINCCTGTQAHFDLNMAREFQATNTKSDFLVLHLSDIVRIAFMAATSDSDDLRLEGLRMLQLIIDKFASVPEPEFPGHVILEQFQAQVGAALRPAFSEDTSSNVTAMACQVCSTWIGSKVARDLNDLRRVHQLLVSSLTKLKGSSTASQLYNESTATLEKLAILKAWAEVYVVAMEEPTEEQEKGSRESLLSLVSPELPSLSSNWLAALRDHAILSLGPDTSNVQRNDNGAFYSADTMDSARIHYQNSWVPILYAATLWLNNTGFQVVDDQDEMSNKNTSNEEINLDRFHLIFGICMEALCSPRSTEPLECVIVCLQALNKLLGSQWSKSIIGSDPQLSIELCNVLHRLLLTRENLSAQLKVMDVLVQVLTASNESLTTVRKKKLKEIAPANQEPKEAIETTALLGEGGESGSIVPGKSVVFALLEVCVCVLVRQIPALNPSLSNSKIVGPIVSHSKSSVMSVEGASLIAVAIRIMCDLPALCSPSGSVTILPAILYLTSGVLKELVTREVKAGFSSSENSIGFAIGEPLSTTLQALKQLASSSFLDDKTCGEQWKSLLRSLLAKMLDTSKTSTEEVKVDEVGMIIAIAVFVVAAPADVVAVPNLQFPCLNLFKQALESTDYQVRIKAVQALRSVFQHRDRDVATPYIQSLGSLMFEHLCSAEASRPTTDSQLGLTVECLQALEVVVDLAEPQHREKMLSLAIPLFVKLLIDPVDLKNVNKWTRAVHENTLHRLMKIGPLYPQEFCLVMGSMPQLKSILEKAIRTANENNSKSESNVSQTTNGSNSMPNQRAPSIKLKTDFSNFSS